MGALDPKPMGEVVPISRHPRYAHKHYELATALLPLTPEEAFELGKDWLSRERERQCRQLRQQGWVD